MSQMGGLVHFRATFPIVVVVKNRNRNSEFGALRGIDYDNDNDNRCADHDNEPSVCGHHHANDYFFFRTKSG